MPYNCKRVLEYNPIDDLTASGGEYKFSFQCCRNGILGRDGHIHAATDSGKVLKIDTTNYSHCRVRNKVVSDQKRGDGWGNAVGGIDGCIYLPIHTYDPYTNLSLLVGDDFETEGWNGTCLGPDGVIYCLPQCTISTILSINPLRDYVLSLEKIMVQCTEQLVCKFQPNIERKYCS